MSFLVIFNLIKSNRLVQLGLLAIVLVLVVMLYTMKVKGDERHRLEAKAKEAIAAAERMDAAADAAAEVSRVTDAAASAKLEKDLTNAYAKTTDQTPSPVRLALACRRLCLTSSARTPEFSARCGPDACK